MATKAHNDYTVDKLVIKAGIPKAMNALHEYFCFEDKLTCATTTDFHTGCLNSLLYDSLANALNEFKRLVVNELRGDNREL